MRLGSLCSGAGGLDLAVEAVFGAETVWHCENDPAASKVLAHRWPGVPNHGDLTAIDWNSVEPVDIVAAGFPCQDVSTAGRRAGLKDDTRTGLWINVAEAVDALRPSIIVLENVRGICSGRAYRAMERFDPVVGDGADGPVLRALGAVLGDLSDIGYDARWATVSASSVGAPHRRERLFIVAIADGAAVREPAGSSSAQEARTATGDRFSDHRGERSSQNGRIAADSACVGRHEGRPEPAGVVGRSDASISGDGPVNLLPTPQSFDRVDFIKTPEQIKAQQASGHGGGARNLREVVVNEGQLLSTPLSRDYKDVPSLNFNGANLCRDVADTTDWRKYQSAIHRWEQLTRPVPPPTELNRNNKPRLNPAFSQWMMGWPQGWVTAVPGITRNNALKIIGNGVVPQQAMAALQYLLSLDVCGVTV